MHSLNSKGEEKMLIAVTDKLKKNSFFAGSLKLAAKSYPHD